MSRQISRHFIDELLTRVDIVDIIDNHVQLKRAGKNYLACCPFHNEKTPSFTVFRETQNYHCFGCQAHGNVIGFLMNYVHLDFIEAIHELASRTGMEVVYEEGTSSEFTPQRTSLYDFMADVATYFQAQLYKPTQQTALNYLKNRGLNAETIKTFGLGYNPGDQNQLLTTVGHDPEKRDWLLKMRLIAEKSQDLFYHRVIFPIHDRRGKIIAFGGRALNESGPKYINSPETELFKKGHTLYGWHLARKTTLKHVLVVEGYMDVVMLAQYGIRNVVATLGTAVTAEQLNQLFHNVTEVTFCFDGDEAGRHAAWRTVEISLPLLRDSCVVSFMFFAEGEDPDSYVRKFGRKSFEEQLEQRIYLSQYVVDTLREKVDVRNNMRIIESQLHLVELIKPFLARLSSSHYRQLLLQNLSEQMGITPKNIKKLSILNREEPETIKKWAARSDYSLIEQLNPVRKLIRFLLYKPTLIHQVQDIQEFAEFNETGINLLIKLLEFIKNYPNLDTLTTAIICQQWAERTGAIYLNELAGQELVLTETEAITREFVELLKLLYRRRQEQQNEQRLTPLWQKRDAWNTAEKQELPKLCAEKFNS